jgi:hypothetical protein
MFFMPDSSSAAQQFGRARPRHSEQFFGLRIIPAGTEGGQAMPVTVILNHGVVRYNTTWVTWAVPAPVDSVKRKESSVYLFTLSQVRGRSALDEPLTGSQLTPHVDVCS